jgi:hypothetical protein
MRAHRAEIPRGHNSAGAGMVVAGMVAAHVFGLAAYGSASNAFCGCVMLSAATQ